MTDRAQIIKLFGLTKKQAEKIEKKHPKFFNRNYDEFYREFVKINTYLKINVVAGAHKEVVIKNSLIYLHTFEQVVSNIKNISKNNKRTSAATIKIIKNDLSEYRDTVELEGKKGQLHVDATAENDKQKARLEAYLKKYAEEYKLFEENLRNFVHPKTGAKLTESKINELTHSIVSMFALNSKKETLHSRIQSALDFGISTNEIDKAMLSNREGSYDVKYAVLKKAVPNLTKVEFIDKKYYKRNEDTVYAKYAHLKVRNPKAKLSAKTLTGSDTKFISDFINDEIIEELGYDFYHGRNMKSLKKQYPLSNTMIKQLIAETETQCPVLTEKQQIEDDIKGRNHLLLKI